MVVARPGDVIQLGELNQQVGPDGVARLRAPEGDVRVEVVGGGRTQAFEAAIAAGYALWLRAAPPEEVRVTFPVNRATLADADRVRVTALARNRGSWLLRVSGSYSPEGRVEDNLALATARAAALADLLRAAGVPENAILVAPPTPPRPGLSPAEQRAVYVQPVDPETSP
jgi:outer membrane protein OmpA-like peptidoglycan-associated protein